MTDSSPKPIEIATGRDFAVAMESLFGVEGAVISRVEFGPIAVDEIFTATVTYYVDGKTGRQAITDMCKTVTWIPQKTETP